MGSNMENLTNPEIKPKELRDNWAIALMTKGVIVRLSISRWRGTAPLKPDELGLKFLNGDTVSFMNKYITFGREKLLPPQITSELDCMEVKARNVLNSYSFDTIWGNFVPYQAFAAWYEENKKVQADYMAAASKLCNKYDEIISTVKNDYVNMAQDVWHRLYPNTTGGATESFIENFVSKIVSKIPSRIDILASFKYNITYYTIPMPSFIEQDVSKAMEIKLQREQKTFEHELEKQTKEKISQEYIKRKAELIDDFLNSTVEVMRNEIAKLCDNVLQGIGKSNKIKAIDKRHLNKLKKMIARVKMLNFYEDKEVNNLLSELEFEITKPKGVRNTNIVMGKLTQINQAVSKTFNPPAFNSSIDYVEL